MLILTDTDALRIDLHQLRQRILQTAGNRCRASLTDIKVREFLCCQLAGGINGSSCLIYDHIGNLLRDFFQKLYNNLLGFAGCSTISQRNHGNMILLNQFLQHFLRLFHLILRSRRINHSRVQNLSGRIHDCQLTSGTKGRIPAKNHLTHDRRLQQKLYQIFAEYADCAIFCRLCHSTAYFTFY